MFQYFNRTHTSQRRLCCSWREPTQTFKPHILDFHITNSKTQEGRCGFQIVRERVERALLITISDKPVSRTATFNSPLILVRNKQWLTLCPLLYLQDTGLSFYLLPLCSPSWLFPSNSLLFLSLLFIYFCRVCGNISKSHSDKVKNHNVSLPGTPGYFRRNGTCI